MSRTSRAATVTRLPDAHLQRPVLRAPVGRGGTTSAAAPTVSAAPSITGPFGEGTYLVGDDIAPGRYRTAGAPQDSIFPICMASRERADGSPIGFPETTNNGPAFITVQASDGRIEFTGDCTWTPR